MNDDHGLCSDLVFFVCCSSSETVAAVTEPTKSFIAVLMVITSTLLPKSLLVVVQVFFTGVENIEGVITCPLMQISSQSTIVQHG